jgi:predicted ATPase
MELVSSEKSAFCLIEQLGINVDLIVGTGIRKDMLVVDGIEMVVRHMPCRADINAAPTHHPLAIVITPKRKLKLSVFCSDENMEIFDYLSPASRRKKSRTEHYFRGGLAPVLVPAKEEYGRLSEEHPTASELGGSLVLVSGEAGIGKSSLISEFCESVDPATSLILAGQCYDLSATPPYGPWIEIFRQLEGSKPPGLRLKFAPEGESADVRLDQSGLFENVHLGLQTEAEVGTLIVVVEDIHWADPASLDLLRFVSRRIRNLAVMIIASYRDDEVSRSHPLFRLLPAIVRESTPERIELRALTRDAVSLLIAGRYRLGASDMHRLLSYLEKHAEGNPLFLHEVLRTLEAEGFVHESGGTWTVEALDHVPLPMLIRQVIEERISRLPSETTKLLELASILGDRVSLEIVKKVSQADDSLISDAIGQALDAHVVLETPDHGAVKFSHALIRQALYQRIPLPRRNALHGAAGEYLSRTANPDLDAVAFHFQQANDDRAIEWLIQSGIRAHRSGAWFTAAERFLAASERLESDEQFARGRGWLLHLAGFMLRYSTDSMSAAKERGASGPS